MKKQMKKLALAKETLRGLDRLALSKLAGGVTEYCTGNASNVNACTYYNSCDRYCVDEPIG